MTSTKIQWTEATWNPIAGCSVVSPGCTNCYAMRFAGTRLAHMPKYAGLTKQTKAGPVWTGELRFDEKALLAPLGWKKRRMIFVNSMSDLFHENVKDEWIDRILAVIALCPQHTFQVLTKRSNRQLAYLRDMVAGDRNIGATAKGILTDRGMPYREACSRADAVRDRILDGGALENLWLGVSIENPATLPRLGHLLNTPARVRWISLEPWIEFCQLTDVWSPGDPDGLDWIVIGGESGPNARPFNIEWARQVIALCKGAKTKVFMKQLGSVWAREHGAKHKKGGDMSEWPEDLRVREFPEETALSGAPSEHLSGAKSARGAKDKERKA